MERTGKRKRNEKRMKDQRRRSKGRITVKIAIPSVHRIKPGPEGVFRLDITRVCSPHAVITIRSGILQSDKHSRLHTCTASVSYTRELSIHFHVCAGINFVLVWHRWSDMKGRIEIPKCAVYCSHMKSPAGQSCTQTLYLMKQTICAMK